MGPILNWGNDWVWGIPLIVLTVIIHSFGLGVIDRRVPTVLVIAGRVPKFSVAAIMVTGWTAVGATVLHGFEGAIWALAYRFLGAVPDNKSAMLYSLGAMTTYGHATITLAPGWQLMGTLEALNGWILFGLTTAFLFAVMQKAWPPAE
ncbi:MAG: hypothetical protein WAK48_31855 [Candidatus Acidiferrum sp.]